jgi:hypothetical protein
VVRGRERGWLRPGDRIDRTIAQDVEFSSLPGGSGGWRRFQAAAQQYSENYSGQGQESHADQGAVESQGDVSYNQSNGGSHKKASQKPQESSTDASANGKAQ